MGFPLTLAFRYMRSKKQASVSVGTTFAMLGVALGVAALATVISVTGGFRSEFREKVLGVNAHVLGAEVRERLSRVPQGDGPGEGRAGRHRASRRSSSIR